MKVGDKVGIVVSPYKIEYITAGNTGTIGSIDESDGPLLYNVYPDLVPEEDWPFYADELEVING